MLKLMSIIKKHLQKTNTFDNPQANLTATATAPSHFNHHLSVVTQSYRNTLWTTESILQNNVL